MRAAASAGRLETTAHLGAGFLGSAAGEEMQLVPIRRSCRPGLQCGAWPRPDRRRRPSRARGEGFHGVGLHGRDPFEHGCIIPAAGVIDHALARLVEGVNDRGVVGRHELVKEPRRNSGGGNVPPPNSVKTRSKAAPWRERT